MQYMHLLYIIILCQDRLYIFEFNVRSYCGINLIQLPVNSLNKSFAFLGIADGARQYSGIKMH